MDNIQLTDKALGPGGDVCLVLDDRHVGAGDHQAHCPDAQDHQQRVPGGQSRCQGVQDAHVPEEQSNINCQALAPNP